MKLFSVLFALVDCSDFGRISKLANIVSEVVRYPPDEPIAHISLTRSNQRRDVRPYVKVSYLMEGPNMLGYSALFHTSSSVSYARVSRCDKPGLPVYTAEPDEIAIRPARSGEGYMNEDFEILGPSRFLAIGDKFVFKSNLTISEYACIFIGNESFAFPIALDLICPSPEIVGKISDFIIGASPNSDFARYAGAFVLADGSRELFIGEETVEMCEVLCRDGNKFSFFPIFNDPDSWIIEGLIGGHECAFELSTGATPINHSIEVVPSIIESITSVLESNGARQSTINGMFSSCSSEGIAALPNIDLQFGRSEEDEVPVIISFTPSDYVVHQKSSQRCMLLLSPREGTMVVGPAILNKLVTVFDARKKRVGICLANIE